MKSTTGIIAGVSDVRRTFVHLAQESKDPNEMLEIVNASFIADEETIFGEPNHDWHAREYAWYKSQSLSVKDIPPPIPAIWQSVASTKGEINSNYGWCIYSKENGEQYNKAISALVEDPLSRQALMIYTRPTMHEDSKRDGMRDFMCTNTVQLLLRNGALHYIVNMRSNDAVFGYKGDSAWHRKVHWLAANDLMDKLGVRVKLGELIWNAGSLHIYPRHRDLIK